MAVHTLERKQVIPAAIDDIWSFFSSPSNLAAITPSYMKFTITSQVSDVDLYAGQIITYTVSPLLNIPLYWMTEITQVEKHKHFVDEQRVGPYKMWHHQHHFKPVSGGVLMTDLVYYSLPMYFLGDIAHRFFVKRQLEDIFDFRYLKIEEAFAGNKV